MQTAAQIGKRIAIGLDRRSLAGSASDDRRTPALAAPGVKLGRAAKIWPPSIFLMVPWLLTEAGSKKRASLHVISGEQNLASFDAGRNRRLHRRSRRISRRAYR